ncbi:carboxypeptidase-like regulatory domain-containing protein [Hymenobacter sp. 15J16-1T3B]|uniref:carboxypeptidase-like regulatory domain-containing protein n=1 Tax=Hymenobacter sp. 15J16-1T3B TaxID=2886941 RepID=UPI001D12C136|nr:carboxypeptidase-like regulatory domain-containing protein [Hymenobacter sp. 15J16-1T3B]MCC3156545.1 carboxypeptidase-like regulatory domain-containing protein [Hymenobacter sp. 15J16-1T3B]
MRLTASPFDPQTGELLPVYRDAYLRGDLSPASARAVEAYLRRDADQAHDTLTRWHQIQPEAEVAAPGWVRRQIQHIQAEPVRFRRRAAGLVTCAALVGGMVFAGTTLPNRTLPTENLPTADNLELLAPATADAASAIRMVTVKGRILGQDGQPLVGATVLQKGTRFGVSTDASGAYTMRVPAGQQTLVYGYGGYHDQELQVQNAAPANVTLSPRAKQRRWFLF